MSRNTLTVAQDRYWWGYANRTMSAACLTAGDPSRAPSERYHMLQTLINEAFTAGARWNMRETSRLSPYIEQFIEMLILLGVFDDETSPAMADTARTGAPGDQGEHDNGSMPEMPT